MHIWGRHAHVAIHLGTIILIIVAYSALISCSYLCNMPSQKYISLKNLSFISNDLMHIFTFYWTILLKKWILELWRIPLFTTATTYTATKCMTSNFITGLFKFSGMLWVVFISISLLNWYPFRYARRWELIISSRLPEYIKKMIFRLDLSFCKIGWTIMINHF